MATSNLRERKKRATRDALVTTALRLFYERGFAEVTVSEICDSADVSLRSFYRYFPDKESVVFAEDRQLDDAVIRALESATSMRPIELVEYVAHALADAFAAISDLPRRNRLIHGQPSLFERDQRRTSEWEALIVDHLVRQGETTPDARLVAGIWRACWTSAATTYGERNGRADPHALVAQSFSLLVKHAAELRRSA